MSLFRKKNEENEEKERQLEDRWSEVDYHLDVLDGEMDWLERNLIEIEAKVSKLERTLARAGFQAYNEEYNDLMQEEDVKKFKQEFTTYNSQEAK